MRLATITIAMLALAGSVYAADSPESAIRAALHKLNPQVQVDTIKPSPVPGLYQVTVGTQIVYMTGDGKYLIQGSIFDARSRTDVTSRAMAELREAALSQVDESQQIIFAPAEGKIRHDVTVFTDIDCGYCRRLHSQIQQYNDYGIAVHYMFFPRAGLNSHSYEKAVSVWCAKDQQAALTAAKQGQEPEARSCDNPVKQQFQLGQELGVQGTPAIIAEDGTLLSGYLPPAQLAERLDSLAARDKATAKAPGLETASQ